ncbi:uncharacterized protein LOC112269994 [Brachypodium distachyon]|uniref:uncharacterized protein LOC112269994 n=1 Tax=Brachypodium distachyon TaxID=15368 RepID=UPI000D0D1A45|nr:uncharacterized protein LOC112269994 [Brachypodium distachyon]|eukprot:XP_024313359.1 uncharacterized protein LOC112269994 [Brachypodium distachyon]
MGCHGILRPFYKSIADFSPKLSLDRVARTPHKTMDHDIETNTLEDLDNRPLKKARCCESVILDDLPSVSASSLVSETCSQSDDHIDADPLPSPPSATKLTVSELANDEKDPDDASQTIGSESADHIDGDPLLSPPSTTKSTVSELMNEENINDVIYELADEEKTDVTYDYLPQGKIFTYYFYTSALMIFINGLELFIKI